VVVIVLDIRPLEEVLLVDKVNVVVGVKLLVLINAVIEVFIQDPDFILRPLLLKVPVHVEPLLETKCCNAGWFW